MMLRNALRSIRSGTIKTMVGGTVAMGLVEFTTHLPSQGKSSEFYHKLSDDIITPLMRKTLDPEGTMRVLCVIEYSTILRWRILEHAWFPTFFATTFLLFLLRTDY